MSNRGGFSWKRLSGYSGAKARVSRKTGIPFTKSGRQRKLGRLMSGGGCALPLALGLLVLASLACGSSSSRSSPSATATPTRTPRPTPTLIPLIVAPSATVTQEPATATVAPTVTVEPATATAEPSATAEPTAVPTVAPPPTVVPVRAVAIPTVRGVPAAAASSCDCDHGNTLNCDDFEPWDAQACYLRCKELKGKDVHGLDRDDDGNACEWKD
jgi:hypothetical protein